MVTELKTERLILRRWKQPDYAPFAEMSADPAVMRYFPSVLSREESDQLASKIDSLMEQKGWGFWAVELKETAEFIGTIGLHYQDKDIPEAPFVEVGWRLSSDHWGAGYATEAALASLKFAFEVLRLPKVYAFTALQNTPSRKVMEKIGMTDTNTRFFHPSVPEGHPLQRHCLYKISRDEWKKTAL